MDNNVNNINNKMKIHFIIPGGGVKGCFQAGFLYRLYKSYSDYFELYQIDGCSVGALNGLGVTSGNVLDLKDIWHNIKSSTDIFSPLSKVPLINGIVTAYSVFYKNGVYKNKLKNIIDNYKINKDNELSKFNCVVSNIRTGIYQYINGTHPKIKDYTTASGTPWIISSPVEIDDNIYTDGALLQLYPIKYIDDSKADKIVIVGYDEEHFYKYADEGDNVLYYLARIIDVCRNNNLNMKYIKKVINKDNVILVDNPLKVDFLHFDPKIIKEGFKLGDMAATKFALQYFKFKKTNLETKKVNNKNNNKLERRNSFTY